jgi:hypothetical protein
VHAFNRSIWEALASRTLCVQDQHGVPGQPELHKEKTLSGNKQQPKKKGKKKILFSNTVNYQE